MRTNREGGLKSACPACGTFGIFHVTGRLFGPFSHCHLFLCTYCKLSFYIYDRADSCSYNASVFQVITGNDYAVRVVANNSLELDRFGPNNKEFSNISVSELKKIYESEYVSGYGDMTLAISAARLEFL